MTDGMVDCTPAEAGRHRHPATAAGHADILARASLDGMLHPQVVLEALRDRDGRVVEFVVRDVNSATCDYLNLPRDVLVGRRASDYSRQVGNSRLLTHFAQCLDSGEALSLEDFQTESLILEQERRFDIQATRIGVNLLSVSWIDVTDRAVAGDLIAQSERHFRLLAENLGEVVTHIRDGRFVWVSPTAHDTLGRPPQHLIGRAVLDFVPPGDRKAHFARVAAIARGESAFTRVRFVADDGSVHWAHMHALPFYDRSGNLDGWTASFRLIDEKVAAEQQVEEARLRQAAADERYRQLTENSAIGMALVTTDNRFDAVNPAMCDFFGYDADTLCTKTWPQLTSPEFIEADASKVADVLAGRIDSYRMPKQYIHADGHLLWGDLSVSCIRTADGDVEVFISQIVNITAEVEARQQLAERDDLNRLLTARLQAQTDRMAAELDRAAAYVASILPGELEGPVRVSSRYLPAAELAGDCYDYIWVDADHLVFYLIDVSGHGIGPALLSVSVHNMLRHAPVPTDTVIAPDKMLNLLNALFQMEQQDDHYLTIWYGVYQPSSRNLKFASAGHPPALMFQTDDSGGAQVTRLATESVPVGLFEDSDFTFGTFAVPANAQLLLFSDGAFEVPLPGGTYWTLPDFIDFSTRLAASPDWSLDDVIEGLRSLTPDGELEDDCSLVQLKFD